MEIIKDALNYCERYWREIIISLVIVGICMILGAYVAINADDILRY